MNTQQAQSDICLGAPPTTACPRFSFTSDHILSLPDLFFFFVTLTQAQAEAVGFPCFLTRARDVVSRPVNTLPRLSSGLPGPDLS